MGCGPNKIFGATCHNREQIWCTKNRSWHRYTESFALAQYMAPLWTMTDADNGIVACHLSATTPNFRQHWCPRNHSWRCHLGIPFFSPEKKGMTPACILTALPIGNHTAVEVGFYWLCSEDEKQERNVSATIGSNHCNTARWWWPCEGEGVVWGGGQWVWYKGKEMTMTSQGRGEGGPWLSIWPMRT